MDVTILTNLVGMKKCSRNGDNVNENNYYRNMKPSNYLKICKTWQGDKSNGHHMVGIK
jgi:hypothetical protein